MGQATHCFIFHFDTALDWQQHAVRALGQALPQEYWMDRMHGRFDTTDTPSSLFRSALLLCFRLHFLLTYFNTVLPSEETWVWIPTESPTAASRLLSKYMMLAHMAMGGTQKSMKNDYKKLLAEQVSEEKRFIT